MALTNEDLEKVPLTFITDTATAVTELAVLADAQDVAVDTETVIVRDADGNPVKLDFDVDGPGPWRVMSIAAVYDTDAGPVTRAWVLDMAHVEAPALLPVFAGITPWGWNANFDRVVLTRDGLPVRYWNDAMLYSSVLMQGAFYETGRAPFHLSLTAAATRYLGLPPLEGKEDVRLNYQMTGDLTDAEQRYAANDSIVTVWVGRKLRELARKAGLLEVCERTCRAQPFIQQMKISGLPFDVETYQSVIDNAKEQVDRAAELVAVATTGRDFLKVLTAWARSEGLTPGEDEVLWGLSLLHDQDTFSRFVAAAAAQVDKATARIAELLGVGEPVEDLFSEGKRFELPFDPDNDTTVRRWITRSAPQFVAEYLESVGSTTRGLTVANDLMDVYEQMQARPADVTDTLAAVAAALRSRTRAGQIVAQYGNTEGPVTLVPDWNIGSTEQVKAKLNEYAPDLVQAHFEKTTGTARFLTRADSLDDKALTFIGGPLCEALLTYRKHIKVVATYGDALVSLVNPTTGRLHASYTQELTDTGRLSSTKPNAQNLSPLAKPHIRVLRTSADGSVRTTDPQCRKRVLVAADLSQAELRLLAHMAGDENMLAAFRSGDDLHVRTANLMFSVELAELKQHPGVRLADLVGVISWVDGFALVAPDITSDDLYDLLRKKAKAVSFGYAYGLKGTSLGIQLSAQGVETSKDEADELLARFDLAYPQTAAYMRARESFITDLAAGIKDPKRPCGIDFEASWQLHRLYGRAASAKRSLTGKLGYAPTPRQIAEALLPDAQLRERLGTGDADRDQGPDWDARWETARSQQAAQVAWALGHYGSAVLATDGSAWSFESRNITGRRRLFQVGTPGWVMAMVALVARSRKTHARNVTQAWVNAVNQERHAAAAAQAERTGKLPVVKVFPDLVKVDRQSGRVTSLTYKELEQQFEDRALRDSFVSFVLDSYRQLPGGAGAREYLFRSAMADQVRSMANQYRNHPIQSGVADAVLEAFGRIDRELGERFPTATMIQSVHDSIVVECDAQDALAVRELVVRHMEQSMSEMAPTVPIVADGDIQLSLDSRTKLDAEQLAALIAQPALAA